MIKRSCLFSFLFILSCMPTTNSEDIKRQPNVILVITDDQGYGDLACHGNPIIKTPFLDKLHADSLRLTDFHVSSCCTPTRASLNTGLDAVRSGAWGTTWGRSLPRCDAVTMAEVFKNSGYKTGFFGKWHLGDNYPFRPEDRGFEEVLSHGGGGVGQAPDYWGNDYFDDTYTLNGKAKKFKGYCTDVWFDNGLKFIEKNKDRPFFCYLSTNAPHGPFLVDKKYSGPYEDKAKGNVPKFFGMITNIDENMGKLMGKIKTLDLEENTILIFMTDNGSSAGWRTFNAGMRGGKGSNYEGGHRVPFFIRWPAQGFVGGKDMDVLSAHVDLIPTFIDLCGLKSPKGAKFDGSSLADVFRGKTKTVGERTLVLQYSQTTTAPVKWKSAVLRNKWRLVHGKELYDISADPGQKKDIANKHPQIVSRLRGHYKKWWEGVSDRFDKTCDIVVGSDHENPTYLSSFDWHSNQAAWSQSQVRGGSKKNGSWTLEVERSGSYEIALFRWPPEINHFLRSAVKKGKALDIRTARLQIGEIEKTQKVDGQATSSIFISTFEFRENLLAIGIKQKKHPT